MSDEHTERYDRDCDSALGWIARLQSDKASQEDREAFALWLAADPARRGAFDNMLALWGDLGSVRHLPGLEPEAPGHREPASGAALSRPAARPAAFPAEAEAPAANSRRWLAGGLAVAACLLAALFLWPLLSAEQPGAYYQTALGEQRTITLPDDSKVMLNTATRLRVDYGKQQRRVVLLRGEAWFAVSRDPTRPFTVDAGSARVTALGTAFNIYRDGGTADITVTEGVVRVTELDAPGGRPAQTETLYANQQVTAGAGGLQPVAVVDATRRLAWQRGEIIADEMPLPELVRQLQRYHPTRIVIADTAVAAMTISGVFQLERPEAILGALEVSLGVQVATLDDGTLQLVKPPQ